MSVMRLHGQPSWLSSALQLRLVPLACCQPGHGLRGTGSSDAWHDHGAAQGSSCSCAGGCVEGPPPCTGLRCVLGAAAWVLSCLCVQGVWSRALGLPIERPKSVTMGTLEAKFA